MRHCEGVGWSGKPRMIARIWATTSSPFIDLWSYIGSANDSSIGGA